MQAEQPALRIPQAPTSAMKKRVLVETMAMDPEAIRGNCTPPRWRFSAIGPGAIRWAASQSQGDAMSEGSGLSTEGVIKLSLGAVLAVSALGFFLPGIPQEVAAIGAMGSILGLAFLLWGRPDSFAPHPELHIDEKGVRRHWGAGHEEFVAWSELVEISLMTQATDFVTEDYSWVLKARDGGTVSVPHALADKSRLAELLSHLPNFDGSQIELADRAETDATFLVWKGEPGDAVELGERAEGFFQLPR
jgi:hypothetical protein